MNRAAGALLATLALAPPAAAVTEANLLQLTPSFRIETRGWRSGTMSASAGGPAVAFGTGLSTTGGQIALTGTGQLALVRGTHALYDLTSPYEDRGNSPLAPSGDLWITNPVGSDGGASGFRTGTGAIAVLFTQGICTVGFGIGQSGARSRYFDQRSKLTVTFYDRQGNVIDTQNRWPGDIATRDAFGSDPGEQPIAAILFQDAAPHGFGLTFLQGAYCAKASS
jgi:hypothetical protein